MEVGITFDRRVSKKSRFPGFPFVGLRGNNELYTNFGVVVILMFVSLKEKEHWQHINLLFFFSFFSMLQSLSSHSSPCVSSCLFSAWRATDVMF